MRLALSTQRLLNVSVQIVTNKGLKNNPLVVEERLLSLQALLFHSVYKSVAAKLLTTHVTKGLTQKYKK